ncbi:BTB/POZ domain-containing protein 18 [Lonchura striata]|uniref:BTB/POZ domain-containing protein 18 n=1 Tax=Lonchura striata TaxID=40157 RepID=A0A218UUW1_9PASE|nr:BTB/POZ domain-containing protein 18 [Lonchura striata domestica]
MELDKHPTKTGTTAEIPCLISTNIWAQNCENPTWEAITRKQYFSQGKVASSTGKGKREDHTAPTAIPKPPNRLKAHKNTTKPINPESMSKHQQVKNLPPESPGSRMEQTRMAMGSPTASRQLLYRSTRLLRTAFQHLYQQQQRADVFCDVVLWAEGEAVVAHCSVLSVCSPFFMEQLGRELPPQGCRVALKLAGLKIGVLRKLVRFFYTAELEVTQEEVHEVLAAARRLRVTELESLQLWGGRLVRLRPQRQLDRSCLHSTQEVSTVGAPDSAEPGSASSAVSPQRQPHSLGHSHPSPIGRMRLRKVQHWGHWEVVQEAVPPAVMVGDVGVTEAQPPQNVDAREQVSKCSPTQQSPSENGMQQHGDSPVSSQGCQQAVLPGTPGSDTKEEEVDVGTGELFLPPGTVCLWPSPSSESEEEVDVLT